MDRADNIVEFPQTRLDFDFSPEVLGNDPLEDLLNEFNDFFDDELWEEEEAKEAAPAPSNEISELDAQGLNSLLHQQMADLEDLALRLNYYMGEIELYLPEKRRK